MKTTVQVLSLTLGLLPLCLAQAEKKVDLEERRRSVANLEQHIEERNERLAELADDIVTLDSRVEKRIDRIVEVLAKSTDSDLSGTKVGETKEQAIQGLRNAIELYSKERAKLKESLRTGKSGVDRDVLAGDVTKFDSRIEKRVEQILELTNSLSTDKEYQKHIVSYEEKRFGREEEDIRINERWRHNHREVIRTNKQRKEVEEALAKSIADLKSREALLESKLNEKRVGEFERDFYKTDLERIKATILARNEQLDDLKEMDGAQANTEEVDSKQAYRMAKSLEDHRADLKADIYAIFSKYYELNRLRGQIGTMTKNLEARKAWLEKYGSR